MNINSAAESTPKAVVCWSKGKSHFHDFQFACMTWRWSFLLALNRFSHDLEMALFPQPKMASPVAERLQRYAILHFHLCLCAINSTTLPTSLSCRRKHLQHLFVCWFPPARLVCHPPSLPCDGSPLPSPTLVGEMAPADFLMLCDGNFFNNETLREARGGICRASHELSKLLCGPGAATEF